MSIVTCMNCGMLFNKRNRDQRRFPNHFCTQGCYHYYQNRCRDAYKRNSMAFGSIKDMMEDELTFFLGFCLPNSSDFIAAMERLSMLKQRHLDRQQKTLVYHP